MLRTSVRRGGGSPEDDRVSALVTKIGSLVRHPGFRREAVVSPLLQRHLPRDAGYAWRGEETLRGRLRGAGLDAASLDHLIGNVGSELARLRRPGGA